MPRVNIREIDLTGAESTTYIENITLVPAVKIQLLDNDGNIVQDEDGKILTLDGTYETLDQFESKVADIFIALNDLPEPESGEDPNANLRAIQECFIQDKGYATAYLVLNGGLPIQYVGLYDLNVESEESGNYTVAPNYTEVDVAEAYKQFEDRGKYDVRFVMAPDFDDITDQSIVKALAKAALTCAGNRGDAVALLSVPSSEKTSKKVDKWVKDNIAKRATDIIPRKGVTWSTTDSVEQYGSYGAIFNPNFITTFTVTAPFKLEEHAAAQYQFKNQVFQGPINYLLCYGKYTKVTPDWFAISGSVRGVTPLAKFIPLNQYGDADVDLLEPRDQKGYSGEEDNTNHVAVNVMCNIRPYGNIIWGNRTMHPLSKPLTGDGDAIQLVASDFLNIRNLCCDIKKTLYRAARRYSFNPNSDLLWFNFKAAITPLLEDMKANDGIREYQIVKVPTTKKALLAARIIISPIEAVEDFDLTVELTDSIEITE